MRARSVKIQSVRTRSLSERPAEPQSEMRLNNSIFALRLLIALTNSPKVQSLPKIRPATPIPVADLIRVLRPPSSVLSSRTVRSDHPRKRTTSLHNHPDVLQTFLKPFNHVLHALRLAWPLQSPCPSLFSAPTAVSPGVFPLPSIRSINPSSSVAGLSPIVGAVDILVRRTCHSALRECADDTSYV